MKAIIQERGNGFPRVGDYVSGDDGELYRVTSMDTRIFTGQQPGGGDHLYAEVELADWSDIEDDEEPTCTAVVAPTTEEGNQMKLTEYTVTTTFGKFRFRADMAEASAPIVSVHGIEDGREQDEYEPSPYQTADAGHDARRAAELLLRYYGPDYYLDPDDDRDDLDHDEYVRGLIVSVEPTIDRHYCHDETATVVNGRWICRCPGGSDA